MFGVWTTSSDSSSYGLFSVEEEYEDEDTTDHNYLVQPMFRTPNASNNELDLILYTNLLQHNIVSRNERMNCVTETFYDSDISLHKCWSSYAESFAEEMIAYHEDLAYKEIDSSNSEIDVPDYVLELDCPPSAEPSVNYAESFTEEMIAYRKDLAYEEIDGWANYHKAKMEWEDAINFHVLSMEEGRSHMKKISILILCSTFGKNAQDPDHSRRCPYNGCKITHRKELFQLSTMIRAQRRYFWVLG